MRILLWHVHGSWTTSFVQGRHAYLVPVAARPRPDGRGRARTWDWPDRRGRGARPSELAERGRRRRRPAAARRARASPSAGSARRPGRDVPAVCVEHNTPQGRRRRHRHPVADRDDLARRPRDPLQRAVLGHRRAPDRGDRARRRRPRPPLHRRAGPRWRVVRQRAGAPRAGHRHRPAARASPRVARWTCSAWASTASRPAARPRPAAHEDLPQAALHDELARRRVYLHPCRWTSLGLRCIEAMHLGMPVVALATTEAAEAVPPGRRGGVHPARRAAPTPLRAAASHDPERPRARRAAPPARPPSTATASTDSWPTGTGCSEEVTRCSIAMVSEHASPLAALGGVDAGGQNVHVAALAAALAARGHEVVVYTRRDDPRPAAAACRSRAGVDGRPRRRPGRRAACPRTSCCRTCAPSAAELRRGVAREPAGHRARALLDVAGWPRCTAAAAARRAGRADLPRARLGQAAPPGRRRHQPAASGIALERDARPRRRPGRRHVHATRCASCVRMGVPTGDGSRRALRRRPRPLPPRRAGRARAPGAPPGRRVGRLVERKGVDDVDRARCAGCPDAELRGRRRARADRARRRPGGAAAARRWPPSRASPTG